MNNSSVFEDLQKEPVVDVKPKLRSEESRLVKIIEALRKIEESEAWSTLKNEVFDGLVDRLERDIQIEAVKNDPDPKKLNRLSGEWTWAKKYSDLSKLVDTYKVELQRIRKLYGTQD